MTKTLSSSLPARRPLTRLAALVTGTALSALLYSTNIAALGLDTNPFPNTQWTQYYIPSTDGVQLHADVLRPAGLSDTDRTPVILSIGPYFSHSGQIPLQEDWPFLRLAGPSDRFLEFAEGADIFNKGYTYVMVDLRGYGGSSGCADMLGPGEQADIKSAVEWAASQSWSTGKVGMYGKSYDGETGLAAAGLRPSGLAAVVAQEPVYDNYRYAFGNGVYRYNTLGTPLVYAGIAISPGVLGDSLRYFANSVSDVVNPTCIIPGIVDQTNNDHNAEFWRVRNLITKAQGSTVPVFLTQGLIESNTAADGLQDYLEALVGPKRAWLGMWDHVRGNDTDASADVANSPTPNALAMGRKGWFDEVMRFFDLHLKGIEPTVTDPNFLIQDNTGLWREQDAWPENDAIEQVALNAGSYAQTVQQIAASHFGCSGEYVEMPADDPANGLWTYSAPVKEPYRISGTPEVTIRTKPGTKGNVAVDLYDLPPKQNAILISQNVSLLDPSGITELKLFSTDWLLQLGHRYVVRITDSNYGRWLYLPWQSNGPDVDVLSAILQLPTAPAIQGAPAEGQSNTTLSNYLKYITYPVPAPQ